jgi:hypothetical protein
MILGMKPGNILKIPGLHKDWSDKDKVILHACFQLLADCVENENLLSAKMFDWKHSKTVIKEKAELQFLYNWWKRRLKKEGKHMSMAEEDKQYKEDNAMLIRLIKIRHRLWT